MKKIKDELIANLVNYLYNTPTGNFNLAQVETLIQKLRMLENIEEEKGIDPLIKNNQGKDTE